MRSKRSGRNSTSDPESIRRLLDDRVTFYNQPAFIPHDPISIPHAFTILQDIEISAFWTAILSWGLRKTIITKAKELFALMDGAPYEFVLHHREKDRKRFLQFRHRTFQPTDTIYFLEFFQNYYREHATLEDAFADHTDIRTALIQFHHRFFDHPYAPARTRKHVSTPEGNAACKRLNMFLRWMVRQDTCGVDFGLWKRIHPSKLMIPLDVHVHRVAVSLGLIDQRTTGWKAAEQLTAVLRRFDPDDPVKYDFALFGMGVLE